MNKTHTRLPFGIPRDLAILACGMFLWGLGEGLFIYFYPLSLQRWTIDAVQIGAVLSGLGVTMALVQAPAGILSDRFGTRPLIRAGLILGVIAAGVMAVATSLPFFIFGLVIYSVTSFIVAPLNSYVTSMRGNWSAQRGITFISGSVQLGAIVGPMLGGRIGQAAGLAMVFRVSAGIFLVATAIVFLAGRPVARQDAQDNATPRAHPLANPRVIGLLIILIITIIALSAPQQLSSVYLQEVHHLSLQQVGLTGTFAGIGAAVILFALGGLPPPAGMIAGQVLLGLFALLLWRGQSAAAFYFGYLFVGGYRLYHSMALAAMRPLVKPNELGLAYGLVETGNALAVILAPLVAGALYDYQPESVYTVSLVALVVTIGLTAGWWFKFARR
ncbi:MFS transporter [bacterium]|nr:MAG: MFS transporter [bacterium]